MSSPARSKSMDTAVQDSNARLEFYSRAGEEHLAPLWKVLAGLVTPEPRPKAVPHLWRYSEIRPFLIEACDLVTAMEAERRVLILENPALPGASRISDGLFCGLQIIKPGETAPAHRHVASALRFIVEGEKAYTAVDGERTMMLPGDFVITPSWVWHDHANIGDDPMVWVDGLDMHIVNLFNASFREEMDEATHRVTRPDDTSAREFGHSMVPSDARRREHGSASPMINYRYSAADEVLSSMASHQAPDPHRGLVLDYLNPLTGDWAMSTLATTMRRLPAGFQTSPYRSTDSTIFVVVDGSGTSRIGGEELQWSAHDVFVAPSWTLQEHLAATEATIFTYSDRACQEKLGIWREARAKP